MVIREFGVEDSIQLVSAALSMISIYKCLAERFSFIRNNENLGLYSKEFFEGLRDLAIPILGMVYVQMATWSGVFTLSILPFTLLVTINPIYLGMFGVVVRNDSHRYQTMVNFNILMYISILATFTVILIMVSCLIILT